MTRIAAFVLGVLFMTCYLVVAQTNPTAAPVGPALNLPGDTVILAKLMANLDLQHCAAGDQIEAQTTSDVKQGKEVLLKRGSSILGHVVSVQPGTANQSASRVVMLFDSLKTKSGAQTTHLIIRALAPESEAPATTTIAGGRGMPGEDTHAGMSGGDHAETGGVPRLNADSVGVAGIPGLDIEIQKSTTGERQSVLSWSKGDIKLKKSTQVAFLVVGD